MVHPVCFFLLPIDGQENKRRPDVGGIRTSLCIYFNLLF